MATKSFYPNIGSLVTLDDFPEQLQFLQGGLQNILDKIYYKELQYVRSEDGSQGYYNIVLVTGEPLKLDLFASGMSIVINPGGSGETIIPLTVNYNWPVLALISRFKLEGFSFLPADLQGIFNQTLNLGDSDLISTSLQVFEENDDLSGFESFVDKINQHYNLSGGDEISYPDDGESLEMAEEIRSAIQENNVITDDVQEVINNIYISSNDSTTYQNNLDLFTRNITGEDILEYIKSIIIPKIEASLELSLGLAFSRNLLVPLDNNGEPLPEPEQSMLVFVPGTLEFNTQGGINFQKEMSVSLNHPSQIGNTKIGINFINAKLDLSRETNIIEADLDGRSKDFIGVYVQEATISLPNYFNEDPNSSSAIISGRNLLIGTGGFSGTLGLEAKTAGDPSPLIRANFGGGFSVSLDAFDITFQQNAIISSNIHGTMKIPGFKDALGDDAEINIDAWIGTNGEFSVTASEDQGITALRIPDILDVTVKSLSVGRKGGRFFVAVSGAIHFQDMGALSDNSFPKRLTSKNC